MEPRIGSVCYCDNCGKLSSLKAPRVPVILENFRPQVRTTTRTSTRSVYDDGVYGLNPVDYVNKESKFLDKVYDGLVKEETNIRGLIEDTQKQRLLLQYAKSLQFQRPRT